MLTPAAQFLSYAEAVVLYNQLKQTGVEALVKTCGPPSFPFGDGMYYQLLIAPADADAAHEILAAFERHRTAPQPLHCPRCRATEVEPLARMVWWKRLYYAGTCLHQCRGCGAEFAV